MIANVAPEVWSREMNCDSRPTCPMTSSAAHDDDNYDSPLRSFLRSIQTTNERKCAFENRGIPADLFDIFQSPPSPASQRTGARNKQKTNIMRLREDKQCPLSLSLDKMALERESNDASNSNGFLPVGKDPDVFVQNGNCQQQPLINMLHSNFPKEDIPATAMMALCQKKKEDRQKGEMDAESKKEEISFYTLNKLMERTASTRCLLLQQTKESNKSSAPLMKSLSAKAFKTIVSSNKITSSTSARSFSSTTRTPDAFTTSDLINSSFDQTVEYSPKPKKPRMTSSLDLGSFGSTKISMRNSKEMQDPSILEVKQKPKPLMISLPSCGSLESASSENESHFEEAIHNSSSSLPMEINEPIQVTPIGLKDIIHTSGAQINCFNNTLPSCDVFKSSSSVGSEQQVIQALSSSSRVERSGSFLMKRKFNSYQAPNSVENQPSRRPSRGFSGGDLKLMLQQYQVSDSRNKPSGKISQTMKLRLRSELLKSKSRTGFEEHSSDSWML